MSDSQNSLLKRLKTRKAQVEHLLEHYPMARENDFYLQYLWLKTFGKVELPHIEYKKIQKLGGALETIRRVRQKIQNEDHKFQASKAVRRKRKQASIAYRKIIKGV